MGRGKEGGGVILFAMLCSECCGLVTSRVTESVTPRGTAHEWCIILNLILTLTLTAHEWCIILNLILSLHVNLNLNLSLIPT